jgi:hypothetical protein
MMKDHWVAMNLTVLRNYSLRLQRKMREKNFLSTRLFQKYLKTYSLVHAYSAIPYENGYTKASLLRYTRLESVAYASNKLNVFFTYTTEDGEDYQRRLGY